MDLIHIRRLRLRTQIGVADWERKARQDLIIDITLHHDQPKAAKTDDLADTIDYKSIRDDLVQFVEGSSFHLLEALAEGIASHVLAHAGVKKVDVTIDKPGALRFADSVAVQIHRP